MIERAILSAEGISFGIGRAQILRSVSLLLTKGTITTLLGPNGAGKTTLLRCLSLLTIPSEGVLTLFGREHRFPVRNGTPPGPWPNLTVVFQNLHLWPHLTLRENLALPSWVRGPEATGRVEYWIERLELSNLAHRYPSEVSGGERQRAAIARALVLGPKILILDEPTSAADVEHAVNLSRILREEAINGMTILLVTHLIGFAKLVSDRVLFIDQGEIVAEGDSTIIDAPPSERMRHFVSVF